MSLDKCTCSGSLQLCPKCLRQDLENQLRVKLTKPTGVQQ